MQCVCVCVCVCVCENWRDPLALCCPPLHLVDRGSYYHNQADVWGATDDKVKAGELENDAARRNRPRQSARHSEAALIHILLYIHPVYILVPWGVLLWDGPHCVCFPPMASHCFTIPQLLVGKHGNKQCSMQMYFFFFFVQGNVSNTFVISQE